MNKKYNNMPMLISFIDEDETHITIDSDMVLEKAIKLSYKIANSRHDKEVVLRLYVFKLNTCIIILFIL